MEVRRKEKTLAGLFSRYAVFFCISTLFLAAGVFLVFMALYAMGFLLPANYTEMQVTQNAVLIGRSETVRKELIPQGCRYGVYDSAGAWLEGDFSLQEQEDAWEKYKNDSIYAGDRAYYRFISMENGNVCIVKYRLRMRYTSERLNTLLPAPEIFMPVFDVILFIVNIIFLSRRFAGKLKVQLRELSGITEKIAGNDLEFQTKPSEIKEIDEVMRSLGRMKDSLRDSLQEQWDMEKQRREQLSALAHDIRTPLTVIRGNAELLEEGGLPQEDRECAGYILTSAEEIEQYLETMRRVLQGMEEEENREVLSCGNLEEMFRETAKQLCAADKIPVSFAVIPSAGEICCARKSILRAWGNIVSNAVRHTDRQRGIGVFIRQGQKEHHPYVTATVRDYGAGFSEKDLQHAAEEFYCGDASRHDRRRQGLGLSITKRFIEAQGGFLEYKNSSAGGGAEVSLWIRMME